VRTISADIVTQLFNAYIGSRAKALEVIARHNALVDRYNALDSKRQQLESQIAELAEKPVQSELDFSQVRKGRGDVEEPEPSPATTIPNEPEKKEAEHPDVESLKAQLAEAETKLQRKTAQLQAKDNQITNLRERLSRAHDSLEEQRKPKAQAV
jgi:DNA repair exonuclease SbcCD ATPase subunit